MLRSRCHKLVSPIQILHWTTTEWARIPFNFLLRDILQYQTNLNDVESALKEATRTIDLILGFGYGGTMDDMNRKATLHANIDTSYWCTICRKSNTCL